MEKSYLVGPMSCHVMSDAGIAPRSDRKMYKRPSYIAGEGEGEGDGDGIIYIVWYT